MLIAHGDHLMLFFFLENLPSIAQENLSDSIYLPHSEQEHTRPPIALMSTSDANPHYLVDARQLPDVDPLSRLFLRMAATFGSPAEYALLEEHAQLLSQLLAPMAPAIADGRIDLEFGLSSQLAVKINVMPKCTTPNTGLIALVQEHPQLLDLARIIGRHRLNYVYGIRLAPGKGSAHIYPNENPQRILAKGIFRDYQLDSAAECIPPYRGYGLTPDGQLRLYAWSKDDGIRERVSRATGVQFSQGFQRIQLWEQARFDPSMGWQRAKESVQMYPFPPWVTQRVTTALNLPYFKYFVNHPSPRDSGYLAREGDYTALYMPMLRGQ